MVKAEAENESWAVGPTDPVLGEEEVHVWCARVDGSGCDVLDMERDLSDDEKEKANRLRFESDRCRFIMQHGVLRHLLTRYLKNEPARLLFRTGNQGKPALAGTFGQSGLHFNISHSAGLALYAVARNREVGIDVECCGREVDYMGLARRFFPPKESELLAALSGQERKRVFFTYWTCKEAYLKAIGMGLFFPLGQVEVTLDEKHQPVSVGVHGESHEDERWSCQQVCPAVDYVSALVTEGKDVQLRCWQYRKCKGVSLSHAIGRIQKK